MIPPNIQALIDELLKDAEKYDRLASVCREAADTLRSRLDGPPDRPAATQTHRTLRARPHGKLVGWAERVLRNAGHSMKTAALMDELNRLGHGGYRADGIPWSSLYHALKRTRDRFVQHADKTWGLAEWEVKVETTEAACQPTEATPDHP